MGAPYHNHQRFRGLTGAGKPLWEFKEFDHRLYCFRKQDGNKVDVILLDGWVKDKEGKTKKEDQRIEAAQGLLAEFLAEFPGGKV